MTYQPILFKGPLVRAILDGTKTVTRRIVKPQPWFVPEWGGRGAWLYGNKSSEGDQWSVEFDEDHRSRACTEEAYGWGAYSGCPYGVAGGRLWVRETWANNVDVDRGMFPYLYRADGDPIVKYDRWRPSIHLPRRASRLTLEVVSVRVERLQEITSDDILAEGFDPTASSPASFAEGWDSINSKRGPWASNPWVWRIEFRKAVKP